MIGRPLILAIIAGPLVLGVPVASAPKDEVKAMLRNTPQVESLKAAGRLRVIDTYASGDDTPDWVLVRGEQSALAAASPGAASPGNSRRVADKIFLRTRTIDTARASVAALRAGTGAGRLEIVQFHGPIKKEWLKTMKGQGRARPIAYLPENAYIVWVEDSSLVGGTEIPIQWREEFSPLDRLSPDLLSTPDPVDVTVLVARVGDHDTVMSEIQTLALAILMEPHDTAALTSIRVTLPPGGVERLALRPEVLWIEPFDPPVTHDERSALISSGLVEDGRPSGPGYLAWLKARGLDDLGDMILDLTDTGIDTGGTQVQHPGLKGRVAYSVDRTGEGSLEDCAGHGTNIAGIIAGGVMGPSLTDDEGFLYGLGVAPSVRVGSTRISNCKGRLLPDVSFGELVEGAWSRGARIGNNSWGGSGAHYNSVDAEYDAAVRDANRDPRDGDQGFLPVFSVGNLGPLPLTVTWPGTAKNVLSVGGSEGFRLSGTDGCGTSNNMADNANDILTTASRGPTADGRLKPDLVAPSSHISSLASTSLGFTAVAICEPYFPPGQRLLSLSSGTSQGAAHVTGAAALATAAYRGWYGEMPSPAMIKAMLINSARDLGSTALVLSNTLNKPNYSQGWGRVDAGSLVDNRARFASDQKHVLTGSGEVRSFAPLVAEDPSKPVTVTLVWTDAPGTPAGWAWVNDLDLVVESNGTTYLGNVFERGLSVPGGQADFRNNVEEVVLPAGARSFNITIAAANIAGDGVPAVSGETDQDFALYVSNARAVSHRGEVDFERNEVVCGERSALRLTDLDLLGFGRISISVESSGDRETVLMYEIPPGTGHYMGSIDIAQGTALVGDGVLTTTDSAPVRAIHLEPDPITGAPVERVATLSASCTAPRIADLRVLRSGDTEAVIFWRTDHPADSVVWYGAGPNQLLLSSSSTFVTEHHARLTGLTTCSSYTATISSTDAAGLTATSSTPGLRFFTGSGPSGRRVIFQDDMESLVSGFTHAPLGNGTVDDWELGFPSLAPPGAFSGNRAWGTNIDGNYSVRADAALVSPLIDLRDAEAPQLSFLHYYAITGGRSPASLDGAWVEASGDGGATWTAIDPIGGYPDLIDGPNPHLPSGSGVFAGFTNGWTVATFDLSAYEGNLVRLRFRLRQDGNETNPTSVGWYIDDIVVSAQGACHQGRVRLNAEEFGCSTPAVVRLSDSDLNLDPQQAEKAHVTASSERGQVDLILTESSPDSGEFAGLLQLRPVPAAGSFTVAQGDLVSVLYADADTGDGTPATATASAMVTDCVAPPTPAGVAASADGTGRLTVTWTPFDLAAIPDLQGYRVYYDADGSGPTYLGTEAFQGVSPIRVEVAPASAQLTLLNGCSHYFLTVTAFDRVGNESSFSPESIAVPAGAAPCASARISAAPQGPGCSESITISVADANADPNPAAAGTLSIVANGPSHPGSLSVLLTETTGASGNFTGIVRLTPTTSTGSLTVSGGDTLTFLYLDLDDGRGATRPTATSLVVSDCVAPVVSDVTVTGRAGDRAVVSWRTDEPATSRVDYGLDQSLEFTATGPAGSLLVTQHTVPIDRLQSCEPAYFTISSSDRRGNLAVATGPSGPFTFGVHRERDSYTEDFERGPAGWTHAAEPGSQDEWELGAPAGNIPGAPPTPFSGSFLWGTDLDGLYERGADLMLVSAPIDLTTAEAATLRFMHWYDIATSGTPAGFDDGAFLEVSTDDGARWTYVTPVGGYPDIIAPNPYLPFGSGGFAGTSTGWEEVRFTLDEFVGRVVRLRFHFVQDETDFNAPRAGWYVDDVIVSLAFPCHEGRIEMDRDQYACEGVSVTVQLADADLDLDEIAADVTSALVTSGAEPAGELVTLTETGLSTGLFEAPLPISASDSPGTLRVREADTIIAHYTDADDGGGNSRDLTATARVDDCTAPMISDVTVTATSPGTVRVEWTTNEPADSRVFSGPTPALGTTTVLPGQRTRHNVTVAGLAPCTRYFFTVASVDTAGNMVLEDATMNPRAATTQETRTILSESFENGSSGWRHLGAGDSWVINQNSGESTFVTASVGVYTRPVYGTNADFVLVSPPFELTGLERPEMTFRHTFDFATEFLGGDGGWVEAWDGRRWAVLFPDGGYPGQIDAEAARTGSPLSGYGGSSPPTMTTARFDLSALAAVISSSGQGRIVTRVRFRVFVESGIGLTGGGWKIDDVLISGDGACHTGRLSAPMELVGCGATGIPLRLEDRDLDLDPMAVETGVVVAESDGGPQPLSITLTETGPATGIFEGAAPVSPTGLPGTVRAAAGDLITITYADADDGSGTARQLSTLIRAAGCTPPVITRISLTPVGGDQYETRFTTDRPGTSEVTFTPVGGGATLTGVDHHLVTSHHLRLRGLVPCSRYDVTVASEDAEGLRVVTGGPGGVLSVENTDRKTLFSDDMEGTDPGWVVSGSHSEWQRGTPLSGPPTAVSGNAVFGTDLTGQYDAGADATLTTPPITLPAGSSAHLSFWHWYDVFGDDPPNSQDDAAWVEVQVAGDVRPRYIEPLGGYPDTADAFNGQPLTEGTAVYAGESVDWENAIFDLTPFAGRTITLRFRLWNDFVELINNGRTGAGWYLDDLLVSSSNYCHDAPAATSLSPATVRQGTTATGVVIKGSGFRSGGRVLFDPGIAVSDVTFISPSQISLNLAADSLAAPGPRNLTVVNSDGQSSLLRGAITILFNPARADTDGSGRVDSGDLSVLTGAFATTEGDPGFLRAADLNNDGIVDGFDLSLVAANFGRIFQTGSATLDSMEERQHNAATPRSEP